MMIHGIIFISIDTQAQYIFLYDAILEGMTSGGTEIPVDGFTNRMKELDQMDRDGETGYQNEFNVCSTVSGVQLIPVSIAIDLVVYVVWSAEVASVPCQH